MLYQIGDNTTANKTAEKGRARIDNHVAATICHLRCTIQQETEIGTHTSKVTTADNKFADNLSRHPFEKQPETILQMSPHTLKHYLF
jgi:hypothetical protein